MSNKENQSNSTTNQLNQSVSTTNKKTSSRNFKKRKSSLKRDDKYDKINDREDLFSSDDDCSQNSIQVKKSKIENKNGKKEEEKKEEEKKEEEKKEEELYPCYIQYDPSFLRFEKDTNSFGGFLESLLERGGSNKTDILKKRITNSGIPDDMKNKLIKKIDKLPYLEGKQEEWFEQLLSIPFGKMSPPPIDITKDDVSQYFIDLMETLNKVVYGLDNVKEEIINYIAQCLTTKNPSSRILALQGAAGTGKTRIVRDGISKVLGTPMKTFSMGGIKDSSHFVGFDYTYQNSKYGAISQALMDSGVMNPVIFLDELDKISDENEGEEIKNLLIHMTDPIQNYEFKDKYFEGINIDISKVVFIFAFNDIDRINPILRDRLHIIKIETPSDRDKMIIANNYIIDELLQNITLAKSDFKITDQAMLTIIQKYSTKNSGVRSIKDCILTILLKINTLKLLGKSTIQKIGLSFNYDINEDKKRERDNKEPNLSYTFPIIIDDSNIELFLGSYEKPDEKYLTMFM